MSDLPAIRPEGGEWLVKVRAAPGAARDGVRGMHGDALKVAVAAAPERGKANRALIAVLARALGCDRSGLALHSGASSRDKWVRVGKLDREELERRLRQALGRASGPDASASP